MNNVNKKDSSDIRLNKIPRISSTEMQRNMGRVLDESLREPRLITSRNRETHALMSIEEFVEYLRLKNGGVVSMKLNEISDEDFQAIMDSEIPPDHDPERG